MSRKNRRAARHPVLRAIRIVVGVGLVVASPLAILVPLLPGPILVLAGLSLLSPESRLARRCLMSLRLRVRGWKRARRRAVGEAPS